MYQEQSIGRMFVKGRARSGIIVLPCGAGKTLVGIMAVCQMKCSALIMCINNLTVKQWYRQVEAFTNVDMKRVFKFVSDGKDDVIPDLSQPCIVISTYTMLSKKDELRSEYSRKYVSAIGGVEWGLLLLDEVQVAPAEVFKRAFLNRTRSHCKLGLTATLIREDNKIEDLQFYIGPKLYEESWIELTKQGYLAKVQCVEIRVQMADVFKQQYLKKKGFGRNMSTYLYTGNPNKFIVLQYLIEAHRKRGDKILIFVDTIDILMEYAKRLGYPYISGDLKNHEREKILQFFQNLNDWNVLLVSRVGDVGIDLPDANVAIEISSLFGSRRQEAQRLGRILRPKDKKDNQTYDSFFYSLVSLGTEEMRYALKRQKFLIKQGYSFQILDDSSFGFTKNPKERAKYKLSSDEDQLQYLEKLLAMCYRRDSDRGGTTVTAGNKGEFKINFTNKMLNERVYIEK